LPHRGGAALRAAYTGAIRSYVARVRSTADSPLIRSRKTARLPGTYAATSGWVIASSIVNQP
jgi:hypothetical protein